jgi:hypothetical protein
MQSHTRQSVYNCGEDTDGAVVDFWVPSSSNFVCSQKQTSGNVFYCHLISLPVITFYGGSQK